jgi:FkbM family methyltransferase
MGVPTMTLRCAISTRLARAFNATNDIVGRKSRWSIQPYPPRLTLESEILRLLRVTGATAVIDVGAHVGGFARLLRQAGFGGPIVSFEPFPESFAELERRSLTDPDWHTRPLALGNESGDATLHTFDRGGGQFNSLKALSGHAQVFEPGIRRTSATTVPVRRLDEVWPYDIVEPADALLKTDTQGHDLDVLHGAGDLLATIPALVMEVAVQPLYDGSPVLHEVFRCLAQWGFEPTGAFPVHRYGRGARVIEFDCTFVKPDRG